MLVFSTLALSIAGDSRPIAKVKNIMRCIKFALCCLLVIYLSGCSSSALAPVSDLYQDYHKVAKGETLYSIAFRYGLDYRAIAKLNHLQPPYKIHPSQKLHLRSAKAKPIQRQRKKLSAARKRRITQPITRRATLSSHRKFRQIKWQWPTSGRVISTFSPRAGGNSGLDIAGHFGQPIYAAATGTVVYCGSGLRGYGKLIIIKHNDEYLSAYAHNSQLLVNEGNLVKAGQLIAKMGNTGNTRIKLHFEIRQAGKPVNPLAYLPK